jgi:hypothetical protein
MLSVQPSVVHFKLAIRACRQAEDLDRADAGSLLLQWEKCHSDGRVVAVPTKKCISLGAPRVDSLGRLGIR